MPRPPSGSGGRSWGAGSAVTAYEAMSTWQQPPASERRWDRQAEPVSAEMGERSTATVSASQRARSSR